LEGNGVLLSKKKVQSFMSREEGKACTNNITNDPRLDNASEKGENWGHFLFPVGRKGGGSLSSKMEGLIWLMESSLAS